LQNGAKKYRVGSILSLLAHFHNAVFDGLPSLNQVIVHM